MLLEEALKILWSKKATYSIEKWKEARDECEKILRSFSVFNGFAKLEPVLSLPLRSSRNIFKKIVKRKLSIFEGFKITSQSLVAITHSPGVGLDSNWIQGS